MAQRGPIYEKVEYVLARLLATAVTCFDVEQSQRTARFIGWNFDHFDARHRKRAQHNIRLCFPDWPEEKVAWCARESTQHLMQLAFETLHSPRVINEDSWPRHIELANLGPAIDLLNSDRPTILLTAHQGNWEVLGYTLALLGYDMDTIARPLDNKLIYDWLLGIREKKGMRIVTKWDATQRMVDVLEAGGALAFTADQNAGDKGIFVPFFGRLASTYKSIGLLAMTHEAPIVCGYAHRLHRQFRFELGVADVIYPEDWADRRDPLYYITARYCRAFEKMVRMCPHQFLWSHRRWKSRPRHERLGKPIPSALRRNLEDLPWMTDDLMHQLDHPVAPYEG
jgi:KDO2-lipid IV(A) lauroyltransferase